MDKAFSRLSPLVTIVLCYVLLFLKLPESFLSPQVVLIDGASFWLEAKVHGLQSLLISQAGYVQLYSRLAALIASKVSFLELYIFSYASHLAYLILLLYLFSSRFSLKYKPLLALFTILVPIEAYWIHGSAINCIWILGLLQLIFFSIQAPSGVFRVGLDICILLLSSLSSAIILWFYPFFVWRHKEERSQYSLLLLATTTLAWLVQLAYFLTTYEQRSSGSLSLDFFAWMQVLLKLLGSQFALSNNSAAVTAVLLIVVGFLYSFLLYKALVENNRVTFSFLLAGLLTSISPVISFLSSPRELYWHADRYKYIAAVSLLWVLLQKVDRKSILGITSITLLVISALNSVYYFKTYQPKMQRSSCFPDLKKHAPLQCQEGLEFRWYFRQ